MQIQSLCIVLLFNYPTNDQNIKVSNMTLSYPLNPIKSTLSNLPTYFLSLFPILTSVANVLKNLKIFFMEQFRRGVQVPSSTLDLRFVHFFKSVRNPTCFN